MMDNKRPGDEPERGIVYKLTAPVRWLCWKFTKCINMDAVYQAQFSEQPIDFGRPDIAKMRLEVKQILKALKFLGLWLMLLASLYMGMSVLSWKYLTKDQFDDAVKEQSMSKSYTDDLYEYTVDIEEIKLLHAGTLICITAFLTYMTCGNKVMSKTHYSNVIALTFLFTMLYFLPLLFIAKKTYDKNEEEGKGAKMFADWTYILIKTTDLNVFGLGFSIFVHA